MTAAFASRGFTVIGTDIDRKHVQAVGAGRAPVIETGLDELIKNNRARITSTEDTKTAVKNSDITFVVVPTPSKRSGEFSTEFAARAFEEIGKALADKKKYHLVVLTSTVVPNATRRDLIPILEKASGLPCGKRYGVCYSPEFIALGTVIRDFLNPDLCLIGEYDKRSGSLLSRTMQKLCRNKPVISRMSIENAEITKIALNCFVTMKISFANMLAEVCEKIPGGNVDAVSEALGSDRRIGRACLSGGLGFGGPCFPRDNRAFQFMCHRIGARCDLTDANHAYNTSVPPRIIKSIAEQTPRNSTVAVLGLSYKPLSNVVEESQGTMLASCLARRGYKVKAYDPMITKTFLDDVRISRSVRACLRGARTVVISNPDQAFKTLSPEDFSVCARDVTVFDIWRILPPAYAQQIRIIPGGCHSEAPHDRFAPGKKGKQ